MASISFDVRGIRPASQGSKRHVGGGRMVEQSPYLKAWREAVRQEALSTEESMALGPVTLELAFRFFRPKGHFNSKGELKPNAPMRMITTPDLDKLQRSTLDALTGVLFKDDSQVCRILAMKCYCLEGELEGCEIVVEGVEVEK